MSSNTHAEIAKHLAKSESLSSKQCIELAQQAGEAVAALGVRIKCIHPKGSERMKALMTGTVEEVAALDTEYGRIKIQSDQLSTQRDELIRLREVARDREASDGMPGLLVELADKTGAVEAARDALLDAIGKLDACMTTTMQTRVRAVRARLPAPSGSVELAQRIEALHPLDGLTSLRVVSRHCDPFEELGIHRDIRQGARWVA
jgi:hypothetical protein